MNDRFALVKFAVFALVCLGFSAWLVATIGNISLEAREAYSAEFTDVTGLIPNDAVKISGVTVGKVTNIAVEPGGTARVDFEVADEVAEQLTEDTVVTIRWRDVFGLRFLYLEPDPTGTVVDPGYRWPIAQTDSPTDLGLLLNRLVPVMSALDPQVQNQVLEAFQEALVGREQEIRDLISNGASLTQAIASRDQEIGRLLENSATILAEYADRTDELQGFIDSFADVSETLEARNDVLEDTITEVSEAQTQLADFVDNSDEEIETLVDELDEVAAILAVNHDNLEETLQTGPYGFVSYGYISRIGQWFNIRAVGFSVNGETISTERGARRPEPRQDPSEVDEGPDNPPNALRGFLGAAGGGR